MSTAIPPSDRDRSVPSIPSTVLVNEDALHRAFLAEYPSLAAEARTDLGADAAALGTKVVEGAFVRAWDARQRIGTPDQLRAFLVDDVHHAAARALSRRAGAHRLAGSVAHETSVAHATHSVEVNPEESWAHILHGVRGEGHSQHALDEAAAISRHEAAEHIVASTKEGSIWKTLAFGAVALAAVFAAIYWVNLMGADQNTATSVNASDARVVSSLPAQVGLVTLDDGSKVRLAPDSKLIIPAKFGGALRAVKLEGAANFDVAKGLEPEFRVYSGKAIIVAKGTSFTVRNYPGDSSVTVVVSAGSVEVRAGKVVRPLATGGALVIADSAEPRIASPDERDAADGWRRGTLSITNRQLRDVLPQLRRWYGIDVKVLSTPLLDRTVTLRASLDSSRQAIRGVEKSTGLEFGYEGQTMVFREPTTSPRKP